MMETFIVPGEIATITNWMQALMMRIKSSEIKSLPLSSNSHQQVHRYINKERKLMIQNTELREELEEAVRRENELEEAVRETESPLPKLVSANARLNSEICDLENQRESLRTDGTQLDTAYKESISKNV
jgi:septal ring factor EnvC (AmiA/AmiB activator)